MNADDLWYLDMGASSHMTSQRKLFHVFDEGQRTIVQFKDGSIIYYEGKGSILVRYANGNPLKFENLLYIPNLKVNILGLGKFDGEGCRTILHGGFLTILTRKGDRSLKLRRLEKNFIC